MKALARLFAIFAVMAMLAMLRLNHPRAASAPPAGKIRIDAGPTLCVSYPHALVRCGVSSAEEFEAQRGDRYLREHYSEVGLVHPAVLTADEWDFASFRGAGGIVWTSKRILIRAGEHVFRDRSGNTIRARCGNRLSPDPQTPVAAEMPPEMEHETPQIEFVETAPSIMWADKAIDTLMPPLPSLPSLPPPGPAGEPTRDPLPAELWQPAMRGPYLISGPLRIGETPEPSTFFLILAPMAVVLLWWKRTRCQSPRRAHPIVNAIAVRLTRALHGRSTG